MSDFLGVYQHLAVRLLLAVFVLFWFFAFLRAGWLISDAGSPYVHHGWLLLLILLPYTWAQYLGWLGFLDDVVNHSFKRLWPSFRSPLHLLAAPVWWLKWRLGVWLNNDFLQGP